MVTLSASHVFSRLLEILIFGSSDRVRAICKAMDLTPIMWSNISNHYFDTYVRHPYLVCAFLTLRPRLCLAHSNDWYIPDGYPVQGVIDNFENILDNASTVNTGFIVLECVYVVNCLQCICAYVASNLVSRHDLYPQTVDVAIGYILPCAPFQLQFTLSASLNTVPLCSDAIARGNIKLESIIECLHKLLEDAYVETNDNVTNPPGNGATTLLATSTASGSPTKGAASLGYVPSSVLDTLLVGTFVAIIGSLFGVALVI